MSANRLLGLRVQRYNIYLTLANSSTKFMKNKEECVKFRV